MRTILITLALVATCTTQAYSYEECDILASLEADLTSVSIPVPFNDIRPKEVIDACSKALARNDEETSRGICFIEPEGISGLLRGKKSLLGLKHSHKLGYPAATFGLATAYFLGDDVPQDLDKARQLFIYSYENGVLWAARGLSLLYKNEM